MKVTVRKGESKGHPFRGNQHAGAKGGGPKSGADIEGQRQDRDKIADLENQAAEASRKRDAKGVVDAQAKIQGLMDKGFTRTGPRGLTGLVRGKDGKSYMVQMSKNEDGTQNVYVYRMPKKGKPLLSDHVYDKLKASWDEVDDIVAGNIPTQKELPADTAVIRFVKGEGPGHPFRGNQHSGSEGQMQSLSNRYVGMSFDEASRKVVEDVKAGDLKGWTHSRAGAAFIPLPDEGKATISISTDNYVTGKYVAGSAAQQRYKISVRLGIFASKRPVEGYRRWNSVDLWSVNTKSDQLNAVRQRASRKMDDLFKNIE